MLRSIPRLRLGITLGLLLTAVLAVQPVSAAVVLQQWNPGQWGISDTASNPSSRCIYALNGSTLEVSKIKVWPPGVRAKGGGTKLRWRFVLRKLAFVSFNASTLSTTGWQTDIRPVGLWATSFSPMVATVPASTSIAALRVWVEIEWRNQNTNALSGSLRLNLEWFRRVDTSGPGSVYGYPCRYYG